jgi:hypothetical protein
MVPLVALGALPLGACVAGMAASAVGAAVQAAETPRDPSLDHAPAGLKACTERAEQLGEVHVIDTERRGSGAVVVWGTVKNERERRSFECRFDGKVSGFKLRAIAQKS